MLSFIAPKNCVTNSPKNERDINPRAGPSVGLMADAPEVVMGECVLVKTGEQTRWGRYFQTQVATEYHAAFRLQRQEARSWDTLENNRKD
jgi:hypothetical protein